MRKLPTMRCLPAALASLALIGLGACASTDKAERYVPEPTGQFAVKVDRAPLELRLAPHAEGLSATQTNALRDLAGRWTSAEGGQVTLKTPEHGPGPDNAYRMTTAARDVLVASGVPASRVAIVGYEADGDQHAPIVVSFDRFVAMGPRCATSWSNLSDVRANVPYAEFGCAVTANIGAQVADPADLVEARASAPPDAGRRQTEIEKYRQGQITSTPKDPQADGTLATVGQ